MTSYGGVISGDQTPERAGALDLFGFVHGSKRPNAQGVARPWEGYGAASPDTRSVSMSPAAGTVILAHSFGDDQIFHRIWFEPVSIEAGFIVEDREYALSIWNAHFDQYADITAIEGVTPQGTGISPDETPIRIQKLWEKVFSAAVFRIGPPFQHTVYRFTINGGDYELLITGMRVIAFAAPPNWDKAVSMGYAFDTVIATRERFKEQRRPLRLRPARDAGLSLLLEGVDAERILNQLAYGHDKVFGVPIYPEAVFTNDALTGQTSFNTANDISQFWNLHNLSQYVMITDHEKMQGEIKEVLEVSGSTISLKIPVNQQFTPAKSVIYPVFFGLLDTPDFSPKTDFLEEIRIGFQEFDDGSLGGIPGAECPGLFPIEPDWSKLPARRMIYARHLMGYPGTIHEIGETTTRVPISLDMGVLMRKAEEFELLDFFCTHHGRHLRCWLKSPVRAFTLKQDMASGSTVLYVERNGAQDWYQGHERIYILMADGELLVRHVQGIIDDTDNDRLILSLDSPLGRDVTLGNHYIIGRYLLARFDMDRLDLSFITDGVSRAALKFLELTAEYSEL